MADNLSTTSYALLGLLNFDSATSNDGLTGYELKQRSDSTLRFYWVSPAMSQIYTELTRLNRVGLVEPISTRNGRRTTRRYRITPAGLQSLHEWLRTSEVDFPVLKHPVALRLLMGHLMDPEEVTAMLASYVRRLAERRVDLQGVRDSLGEVEMFRFPAMVADWGLAYYDAESDIVGELIRRMGTSS